MNDHNLTTPKVDPVARHPVARFAQRHWPTILIGVAWLWLFWPMMIGETVCGFRDSAYLYYPLFQWIDAQWAAGEIPLWNPYCNYGMPVVGDGSSSVFYPGKLIFFCRFLSYPSRYGIYLAMHIPLAAAGTYWLAKTFRASKPGATLAACGYAFGGSVLFQTTNVIFLVSAAWLPFAVCCVWRMIRTGEIKWAIAAGVCCALMILGGDPQMTYHVGLIAAGTILIEAIGMQRGIWRRGSRTGSEGARAKEFLFRSATLLTVMVLVTSLLAAVQIIPTYQWSQRSERTNPSQPANLFQAALNLPVDVESSYSLVGEPDGTIDHAYQFSREPWSMLELVWPNFSGKPFPINQRWTNRFPGADRIWIPSIYMGVLVSMFGLFGLRLWGVRRRNVWLTWLLLIFLLGSLGWYGPVWLYSECFPPARESLPTAGPGIGPQVGGVYWMMQIFLPKYFAFRYPAKLFVIASLALSVLAGINLRHIRLKHCAILFAIVAIASAAEFGLLRYVIPIDPSSLPKSELSIDDAFFGPYDAAGSMREAIVSAAQVVLVFGLGCLSFLVVSRVFKSRTKQYRRTAIQIALVLLAVLDVTLANRWMLAEIPASAFETETAISAQIELLKSKQTDQTPVWLFRDRYQTRPPLAWLRNSSDERLAEIVQWQRESLYPKQHLSQNVTLMGSFASVWPQYYERELNLFETASRHELTGNMILGASLISGNQPEASDQPAQIAPVIWLSSGQSDTVAKTPVEITSFTSNRVTAKFEPTASGSLAFGRIAEAGWSATIKNLSTGEVQSRRLELDRQQETLFLNIEAAGDYEVEFRYLPLGFLIGLITSLVSLVVLLLCCVCYPVFRPIQLNRDLHFPVL